MQGAQNSWEKKTILQVDFIWIYTLQFIQNIHILEQSKHEGLALTLSQWGISRLYKNLCIHMIQFAKM